MIISKGLSVGNQITTRHNEKQLSMVMDEQSLNWDNHPVRITNAEMQTLNAERVLAVMQGDNLTPSALAGLRNEEIVCETIHLIDTLYGSAVQDYKQRLAQASRDDLTQIRTLMETHKWAPVKTGTIGVLGVGATGALIGSTLGPIGAAVGGIAGAIFGFFAGFFGGKSLTNRAIEREGSAHRVKWMQAVDILEDVRFKQIRKCILNSSVPLVESLVTLEEENQTDRLKIRKLQQLCRVYHTIFGEVPLDVVLDPSHPEQTIDVIQYVNDLTQKFSQLRL